MALNVHITATPIPASTTSAQGTLTPSSSKYIRVVNGSTALCYVNAGANPTATSANPAVGPNATEYFERDPNTDAVVAVLLSTGTGQVSVSPAGTPGE